jgi:hypothetical protein
MMQGEKMNQPTFVNSVLNVKESEECQKTVAHDLTKDPSNQKSISELLHDTKTKENDQGNK